MTKYLLILCLLATVIPFATQAQTDSTVYNKQLADSLGADDYGMKKYFFVILKTGSTKIEDKDSINTIFRGHLDNITQLVNQGKLIVAGPFSTNEKQYRGLYIFDVKTKEELETLLTTDPAVKENVLEAEIYEWYGSAALPMYLPFSYEISKKSP